MLRKLIALAVVSFVFAGCGDREGEVPSDADLPTADASASNLKVNFVGLIAFVQDGDTFWALLPDAHYEPANALERDLPPDLHNQLSAFPAAQREGILRDEFPSHVARITIKNAEAVDPGTTLPQAKDPIEGSILSFAFAATSTGLNTELAKLTTARTITDLLALNGPTAAEVGEIDKVDNAIFTSLANGALDSRLAAAVRLQNVKIEAMPTENSVGEKKLFTFKPAMLGADCPTTTQRLDLAELVVATGSFSGDLEILRGSAAPLKLRPQNPALPIEITISNESDHESDHSIPYSHYGGFRWFYSLLDPATRPAVDHHYVPCEPPGLTFIGNKCPEYGMSR